MDSKLDALLGKMEAIVTAAEKSVPSGSDAKIAKMEELLARLEKATAAGGSVPQGTAKQI